MDPIGPATSNSSKVGLQVMFWGLEVRPTGSGPKSTGVALWALLEALPTK
jgi:hypothetical protein